MGPIRPGNDDDDRGHVVHDIDDGRADDDFDIDHHDGGADHLLDVDDDFDVDDHDGCAFHDHHGPADDHDGCAFHDHHGPADD
ncbi:MAG: DNA primase, partial [Acidimicrobiia bacterium]